MSPAIIITGDFYLSRKHIYFQESNLNLHSNSSPQKEHFFSQIKPQNDKLKVKKLASKIIFVICFLILKTGLCPPNMGFRPLINLRSIETILL